MLPGFTKVQVDDDTLNRVQDRLRVAIGALTSVPLLDGVLLENVVLAAGSFTPVVHNLTRPWRGYLVLSRTANAAIWNQAPAADAVSFLYLQPSATVTVNIWVF